jgi:dimethylhistidine N-methyltransferase
VTFPAVLTDAPPLVLDALAGLRRRPRTLPSKYFYDAEGSRLFEAITQLDAYYPTRTEAAILRAHGEAIAAFIRPDAVLVEYGSGASVKTRLLLDRLPGLRAYVPLDISEEHLLETAEALRADYPRLRVVPVAADYTRRFRLPRIAGPRSLFFPGSTVGNFTPAEAAAFLRRMARTAGPAGRLVIGVDTPKDRVTLERAYDDEQGVTAAFNKNLLVRLNREAGADFDLDAWAHRAVWNEGQSRVEMHLVSTRA